MPPKTPSKRPVLAQPTTPAGKGSTAPLSLAATLRAASSNPDVQLRWNTCKRCVIHIATEGIIPDTRRACDSLTLRTGNRYNADHNLTTARKCSRYVQAHKPYMAITNPQLFPVINKACIAYEELAELRRIGGAEEEDIAELEEVLAQAQVAATTTLNA